MSGTRRNWRVLTAAGVATVALAAVSTFAIAAMTGNLRPSRCPEPKLAGHVVDVTLSDMGGGMMGRVPMMAGLHANPRTVPAGTVSFLAHNGGSLVHEMLVLPLPTAGPGTRRTRSDGKVDESQRLGEASRSCAPGTGDGIASESTGWVTLNLPSGRYELLCDEPWHYAAGMSDTLTVP